MAFASASYRVWNRWYLGVGYLAGSVDTRVRLSIEEAAALFDPVLSLDIGGVTIPITFDSRDHELFPRSGTLVKGRAALYRKGVGSDFDAKTFMLSVNQYLPVRDRDVVALRGYFRTTGGDAPFFLLSTFGGSTDLRGYPSGRYRDQTMYAVQGEYRWQFSDRWIFSGFAGFGEVAQRLEDFGDDLLPAAGLGTRFVISKRHRVSLSFDIAQGRDDTEYYFGVGEAF